MTQKNFKTCKVNDWYCFVLGSWNFCDFRVFDFGPYVEIENSEIFSTTVNSKECVLLEDIGNFRGFRVFDFETYTGIENSEILSTLVNSKDCVLLEEVGNCWGFRVFNFGPYAEINFVLSKFEFYEVKNF